jgi:hypothetical protein
MFWIRIYIFNWLSVQGSGLGIWIRIQASKSDQQDKKKVKGRHVLKMLDALFGGLEAFSIAWKSFM